MQNDSTARTERQTTAFPDPIPGIIPFGTVTLFAGAPGVGKTAMLADWCARWRDGRTIFNHPTHAPTGGLFYLSSDRGWRSARQWFDLVGFADIPHYSLTDDEKLDLGELKDWKALLLFDSSLAKLNPPPGAHVIVDPVSPLFIAGSPNDTRCVARSMLHLSRTCVRLGINISATAHFGKQKGDAKDRYVRPQDRIAGSTSFSGFTDTQIYLTDPELPDFPHHRLGWVPRHAPVAEFSVKRDERGLFVPVTLEDALETGMERVYRHVPASNVDPISFTDLMLACGLPRRSVYRALGQLIKDRRVERVELGYYRRTTVN